MNKTAQTTEYAPGWDIDNFRRTVIAEVNNGNRTHLMIRAENCNQDIEKLKKNIEQLASGTEQDKQWIRAYANTIEELTKIREYIKYSLTFKN